MTAEIRQKIWNYAVMHDTPVSPKQAKDRSNKFWPYHKITPAPATAKTKAEAEDKQVTETLITAAQLSRACHQIYDEVAGTGLFYQINEITFVSFNDMLAYLVAITPVRRNAIRSVIIKWNHDRWTMKHAITMLATCQGLRNLEITIHNCTHWFYPFTYWTSSGFQNCVTSDIRGLESFKLIAVKHKREAASTIFLPNAEAEEEEELAEIKIRSREVEAIVTQPRVSAVSLKQIMDAQEASRLNIFGEGRLGPDKKPGIIASRTRGQLQKQKTLNDFGLLEEAEEHPKFSKFGDLLWDIRAITESRELASDYNARGIEVNIVWADKPDQTWEILDRIVNSSNVLRVARHFVRNPEAYDLGIAISTIKEFVEKNDAKALALESLKTMMKRNDSPEAGAMARRLPRSRAFR
jgi:hypothetical protein